jgi:shikimate kinase
VAPGDAGRLAPRFTTRQLAPAMRDAGPGDLRIAIVGPCAAGKTSLASALRQRGYHARQIAQEHSYVPAMWQILARPDILIYLDASFEVCTARKRLAWRPQDHAQQLHRLRHARENCHIYIQTDALAPEEVARRALAELGALGGPGAA